MLSASAFNAFLKTLEEPPSYAIFILATTEKHKILPTILSRCQIFDFKRITNSDTVEHLHEIADKEGVHAEKAALQVIAQKSEGCMRDSLSILDKIVSFTNGEVTYKNTLEHLNILDHDYYFGLLDTQLTEDMAGSMLLYDEINRKGFEGDLVLNGFAEFIRNLLVAQHPKAASLLDVVEGLQPKYIETAKKVSPAYLVSALNILNEAEINYKMARNKRLHVEMTMIKLTFLQQAIELSFDNQTSTVVKKKRVSGPVAVKFEPLQSIQIKAQPTSSKDRVTDSKLYVQPGAASILAEPTVVGEKKSSVKSITPVLKPIETETVDTLTETVEKPGSSKGKEGATGKKSLLEALRDQHITNRSDEDKREKISVTNENLQEHWNCFKEKLKQQCKFSVVTVFNNAKLQVVNEQQFSITVSTSLEQKFIEQEKTTLLEYLKVCFHNRNISFFVTVDEHSEEKTTTEPTLTTREKYLKVVEQYPMIKELKDRLKLELDY
jgi:DNA polymerase III subunit gamma/tau